MRTLTFSFQGLHQMAATASPAMAAAGNPSHAGAQGSAVDVGVVGGRAGAFGAAASMAGGGGGGGGQIGGNCGGFAQAEPDAPDAGPHSVSEAADAAAAGVCLSRTGAELLHGKQSTRRGGSSGHVHLMLGISGQACLYVSQSISGPSALSVSLNRRARRAWAGAKAK